jgi:UDP-N-acetylmuramoyl-tripeptide--D-alanyl-D-alanine ligase
MKSLSPSQIERWTGGRWVRGLQPGEIATFRMDARAVTAGDVFVALRTGRRDAHEFVPQAAAAGASFVIVERPVMSANVAQLQVTDTLDALHRIGTGVRKEFHNPLVAITGSCGKTSTKDLLALLLGDRTLSTEGNLNNYLGLPLTLARLDNAENPYAVVEVGISMQGEMAPLAQMAAPDHAIVTCVAPAHLEGLGSIEGVAAEKAVLPASVGRGGTVFFPAFCLQWEPFRELSAKCFVTANADAVVPQLPAPHYALVRYQAFHSADGRTDLMLFLPGRDSFIRFNLPHLSDGMQSNAALAFATALELGVSEGELRTRMASWKPARMRGEIRVVGETSYYVDCYNANPASMLDAVRNFRESFPKGRRLLLIGCMNELGEKSGELHRELGRKIDGTAGDTYCIHGTQCEYVREGLLSAGVDSSHVVAAKTREEVVAMLDQFQNQGGAVFVKGSRAYRMEEFLPPEADVRKDAH